MSVSKGAQWRRLLFFSILAGIIGQVPDSHASSFYLEKPDTQQLAQGRVDWSVDTAGPEVAAFDGSAPSSSVPVEMTEVPVEVSPVGTQDQNTSSGTDSTDGSMDEEPEEECDEIEEGEVDDEDLESIDSSDEKPEIPFGAHDYLADTDPSSSPSATNYDITTTTTVQSSPTSYSPIVFWTVAASSFQPVASPALEFPFDSSLGDGTSDEASLTTGEVESTAAPEEIVAMASPNSGSVIGISVIGGALAVLLLIIVGVLFWGYGCICRRSRRDMGDDYDYDDKMSEAKYTVPTSLRGALEDDNGKWLDEWRKRKDELISIREPPEVHVSNAVPMSPNYDLEYGRDHDSERFYNCPL